MFTENKILDYDYNKLMGDFKVKEKLKAKSQQKVFFSVKIVSKISRF